jgi:predicted RNA-binding protein with PUA-like domain
MNYFLAKTEPGTYSIEDLKKDVQTTWNGVKNPQAIGFIKKMRVGDRVFIYHSGGESAIRGLAEVVTLPRPDEKIEKSWVVDLKFLVEFVEPVSLREIKESGLFEDFRLVYQSRLSVMDVPERFVQWLKKENKLKF